MKRLDWHIRPKELVPITCAFGVASASATLAKLQLLRVIDIITLWGFTDCEELAESSAVTTQGLLGYIVVTVDYRCTARPGGCQ